MAPEAATFPLVLPPVVPVTHRGRRYPRAVIDPRLLRDDPDRIRAAQDKRGLSGDVVDQALEADAARRAAIADFEQLRAEQKQLGKLIPKAQGEEKADLLARTKTARRGREERRGRPGQRRAGVA